MNQPIDHAVARLIAAYHHADLPPIRPPRENVHDVLADIGREIAPLSLPEELSRFWQLVDPTTLTVGPYPHPTTPEFALEAWASHRDESPGMTPRLLFPLAYESHGYLFVELDDHRGHPGGPVLEWGYGGGPFHVRFAAVSGYVDLLATMIELGEFTRHETETHSWVEFDPERRWRDAASVRLTASQPLARLGSEREIDEDVRRWPEHWLLSDGLTDEVRRLRGATTTVAELLVEASRGTRAAGTIQATVTSLAGSALGRRIAVDDGTGILDVWCPAAVCTFGPVMQRTFEFDLVVESHPTPPPDLRPEKGDVQDRALAHDLEGAQAAAMDLYAKAFRTSPSAEAIAIRPLE